MLATIEADHKIAKNLEVEEGEEVCYFSLSPLTMLTQYSIISSSALAIRSIFIAASFSNAPRHEASRFLILTASKISTAAPCGSGICATEAGEGYFRVGAADRAEAGCILFFREPGGACEEQSADAGHISLSS